MKRYGILALLSILQLSRAVDDCQFSLNGYCYAIGSTNMSRDDAAQFCAKYPSGLLYSGVGAWQDDQVMVWLERVARNSTFWINARQVIADWYWFQTNQPVRGQGCWGDNGGDRDLDGKFRHYPMQHFISYDFTPTMCLQKCKKEGYKYAGLQAGEYCYCGDGYGRYQRGDACTEACAGDKNLLCGGNFLNYVYLVSGQADEWVIGTPTNKGNCAVIDPYKGYKWRDRNCVDKQNAVCRSTRQNAASEYECFTSSESGSQYCFLYIPKKLTWFEARRACQEKDGVLAYVPTSETYNFVTYIANSITKYFNERGKSDFIWIGLTNSIFEWEGSKAVIPSKISWLNFEPKGIKIPGILEFDGKTTRCIFAEQRSGKYGWATHSCGQTAMPLCRFPKPVSTLQPTTRTTSVTIRNRVSTTSRPGPNVVSTDDSRSIRPTERTTTDPSHSVYVSDSSTIDPDDLIIYLAIGGGCCAFIIIVIALIMCLVLTKKQRRKKHISGPKTVLDSYEIEASAYENRLVEGKEGTPPSSNLGATDPSATHPSPPPRSTSLDGTLDDDGSYPSTNTFTPLSVANDQYYVNHEPAKQSPPSPQPYYQNTKEAYASSAF